MASIEWYYGRGDQQSGPVSPQELKRMAAAGELAPEDLVWREGMEDWAMARTVRGLFDEGSRAAGGKAAAKGVEPTPALSTAEPSASITFEPLDAKPSQPPRHVFDAALDRLRAMFPPQFVYSAAAVFGSLGLYGLYLAAVGVAAFAAIAAVKLGQVAPLVTGLTHVLILLVLQYAARRFLEALDRLVRTTTSTIASTAFPDCFALTSIAVGLAVLLRAAAAAIQTGVYWPILGGLLCFIICEYLAIVSLNLAALGIGLAPSARASEEAIGLLSFVMKALLSLTPVAFGAGVVLLTCQLFYATYLLFSIWPPVAVEVAETTTRWLFAFAAMPLAAYLVFLVYYLVIDVIRTVLTLGGKNDEIRLTKDEGITK